VDYIRLISKALQGFLKLFVLRDAPIAKITLAAASFKAAAKGAQEVVQKVGPVI
jgi:hypothetical protein